MKCSINGCKFTYFCAINLVQELFKATYIISYTNYPATGTCNKFKLERREKMKHETAPVHQISALFNILLIKK
jgi:hypothetical protein